MTVVLASLAPALLLVAAWEALGALMSVAVLRRISAWLGPARGAGGGGIEPAAAERRRLLGVAGLALAISGWIVSGPALGLALAALAPAAARVLPRTRRVRWRRRAAAGAAPVARALADALSVGCPLPSALSRAARDGAVTGPAQELLAEASALVELCESLASALRRVADRAGGGGWATMTAAMLVQRETGGDLAGLLRDLAAELEAAERAEGRARAASAQARLTARIVLVLPLAGVACAELAAPGSIAEMLADQRARLMVSAALLLQLLSLAAVRRITRALR